METHTLDNLGTYKEKAPVIAYREHMNLSVAGTLTNTEHALIRAEGNLTIGGQSDENGKITGKTEKIENRSAYLESGGNMTIWKIAMNTSPLKTFWQGKPTTKKP